MTEQAHIDKVKNYYGHVLANKNDLKTTACCVGESLPPYLSDIVSKIHHDVKVKFYGCGVPVPGSLNGLTVLDLGSGSGRDAYLFSALVGEKGKVIGVDMTKGQLDVANQYKDFHQKEFGHSSSNVEFCQGYIEDLASADISDNSIDLVVSNCVINLSPDKNRVFSEIFRVLKPGGELYFSDVYTDRRLSDELRADPVVLGECLGGALYVEDFRRILLEVGCHDYRQVSNSVIEVTNPEIKRKVGNANFYSITYRAFKLDLEDRCEDYGQVATYKGSIDQYPNSFALDDHHFFETGKPMLVCSNTADMLQKTRFKQHFEVSEKKEHFGLFDCGPEASSSNGADNAACC
ncbi:MAG: methyltransferase domain-containing protein [Oligoflexales bacterium]|nr:methyltransferase domain-containing protein [Oligoflexales bacterium]